MRRMSALLSVFGCACFAVGCSDHPDDKVFSRSDVVSAAQSPGAPASPTSAKPAASAAPAKKRKFCARPPSKPGAKPSSAKLGSVHAPDESPVADSIVTGGGKWTWINVWAGWCEPCLEEIPLLKSWEAKMSDRLRVVFVSIDDDPRLAVRFLTAQPKEGVRKSHHLGEIGTRAEWFETLGASTSTLPVQILLDPDGGVRCVEGGAIDAADLPAVQALITR